MKRIYLLTTEHLENGLWFREEADFKVAMNYVAIEAAHHPDVAVLAFTLMSNHVHFVLKGLLERVEGFVNRFKHRYAIYYRRKYGVKKFLRRNELDVKEIPYDDEAPEKVIAYTVMNAVAAGICAHPSQYPWGTGHLYFSTPTTQNASRLKDFSIRAIKRITHSDEESLPENWHLVKDGYILPQDYVDVKSVEKYKTLYKSKDAAFAGRLNKMTKRLPSNIDILSGIPQSKLLVEMSRYQKIYAVGRTAIQARILGCEIGVYDEKSTITLYDKNNQPLSSGIITRMYSGFSISLANQFEKHRKTVNHK